jgi:hypothetical protein
MAHITKESMVQFISGLYETSIFDIDETITSIAKKLAVMGFHTVSTVDSSIGNSFLTVIKNDVLIDICFDEESELGFTIDHIIEVPA